ncbi:hypothetical protein AYY18_18980 [Morganella psychrotolerans]|uniref:Lipoprotein SmpA/OmlA domain-containing protein n=1 Tax=Morganella psychrotolerans TaxID=368603 RepID=A0A1B8HKT6_9GAMM|nr:hypothetical protein AYY18_18980 [Morganella psychrotolerans]
MLSVILVAIVAVSLSGCGATAGNKKLANETQESIQTKLISGQTTKAEVKAAFGDPSGVGFTSDKEEQWSYAFANTKIKGKTFIPFYGMFAGGATTKLKQLVIIFKGDVVDKYTMSDSETDVKNGM